MVTLGLRSSKEPATERGKSQGSDLNSALNVFIYSSRTAIEASRFGVAKEFIEHAHLASALNSKCCQLGNDANGKVTLTSV